MPIKERIKRLIPKIKIIIPEITIKASRIWINQNSSLRKLAVAKIKSTTPKALKPTQRLIPIPGENHFSISPDFAFIFVNDAIELYN